MFFLLFSLFSPQAFALTVDFHPTGYVKAPRQVRAIFSEAMVNFGDPLAAAPFEMKCAEKGKGTWEDSRTWIFEFSEPLSAGAECSFTGKAKSLKGEAFSGVFTFHTGAPNILSADPYEGGSVEEQQAYLLRLDGEVEAKSVETNAYFLVEGIAEKIPVKIVSKEISNQIVKKDWQLKREKKLVPLVIQPVRPFPPNKKIQLVWGKGIRSIKGTLLEQNQFLAYRTREPFKVEFSCERENANAPCLPITPISLRFSTAIAKSYAEKIELKNGKSILKPELSKDDTVSYLSFKGPFPAASEMEISLPKGIKDDSGRTLSNEKKFPLKIKFGKYPPLAKFAAPFGMIEAADPVLPVTLRNIEPSVSATHLMGSQAKIDSSNPLEVIQWLRKLKSQHDNYISYESNNPVDLRNRPLLKGQNPFTVPKPNGKDAFEVLGIPLKEKGFHVVELESKILGASLIGKPTSMFVASGALVTNLSVHFKWGKENALVWVSSLDKGQEVGGAKIKVTDCSGAVIWEGKSEKDGTVVTDALPQDRQLKECEKTGEYTYNRGVFVFAEKDGDFSFTHSSWHEGIEPWRFNASSYVEEITYAHTVFDRTLFRAGQTVHMKHILREPFMRGLRNKKKFPSYLVIQDSLGKQVSMPVAFSANGHAESQWKIPLDAGLGSYSIYLTENLPKKENFELWGKGVYSSGSFRVEEFRLPVLSGSWQFPGNLVAAKEVSGDIAVKYLSGGGASGLPVLVRSRVEKIGEMAFPDFEGFTFANGGIFEGKRLRNYNYDEGEDDSEDGLQKGRSVDLTTNKLVLDENGTSKVHIKGIPVWDQPIRLTAEAEYKDPNGQVQTLSQRATIAPSGALIGIKPNGWAASTDNVKFQVAVVNSAGKPLTNRAVKVDWFEKKVFSHRKKIIGGFYSYENFEEIKKLGTACIGNTDAKGILLCEGKAPASGNLGLMAETEEKGLKSRANRDIWVSSKDDWWFQGENNDRIDLLSEKKKYEPGEKARLQVRMPFREGRVLITVEREGVLDHYVQAIDAKNPVIDVPMKNEYAPNVYVSAFVIRGRVEDPKATALIDLAKPAYKLGVAEIKVGWKAHELNVKVEADKTEYKIREKSKVKVSVTRAIDGKPAADGEVVLMAVDEALLEIQKNTTWDLLSAMMGHRGLSVITSTAQTQVVGKRHFGLKALPSGGGGGVASARELFDTLLFWKAKLSLDKNGEATAEIPMNDSLTSFRIVAVATEGADRFGNGDTAVKTSQDLMLFAGASPFVREGDDTNPELTLRNASKEKMQLDVMGTIDGKPELATQKVQLAPGESKKVSWKFTVPAGKSSLAYEFTAQGSGQKDAVKVIQKIQPPKETIIQSTLEQVAGAYSTPIAGPTKNISNGKILVRLQNKLGSGLDGVKKYMSEYPYDCLEQKTSIAVSLRDPKKWSGISFGSYLDSNGLFKYFPESLWGTDSLTTYVLSISQEAGYVLPQEVLPRAIEGLSNFISGKNYYAGFQYPAADLAIRKLAAMEALSRYQSFNPQWLSSIVIEPQLWPLSAVIDWKNLLDREQKIPDRAKRLQAVEEILRSRIEWRGTIMGFKNEQNLWWLMRSADSDANRLLLAQIRDAKWESEMGRLVRGVLARQKNGMWDLTTANAWGVLAMERFSERFEKEEVTGQSELSLAGAKKNWVFGQTAAPQEFPWPKNPDILKVQHGGTGKPWVTVQARAVLHLKEPIFKGYQIKRRVTPVQQKIRGKWSVGDIYKVSLEINAPADMTWVALTDPIPAGATVLGSGLGGESALASGGAARGTYATNVERSFEGYRAYYEWLPKGKHIVEYTVRLNAVGKFFLPNSRIEAMYSPEMYAEMPNDHFVVLP